MPQILSVEEVDLLLRQPSDRTPKGLRDRAMLELLYATGIRVSELIHLEMSDVNLAMGYINCRDTDSERVIPFGSQAKKALQQYMHTVRNGFLKEQESEVLFTNCSGKPMSRQGFWKVLKHYAQTAGIEKDITPQYSAAFVCRTSDPERSRLKKCAGDAGTFGYIDNADVSEYECV